MTTDRYLFRGKTQDGEWLYGSFIAGDCSIISSDNDGVPIIVDPSTVGQYTGLRDSSGNRIFEGDIIRIVTKYLDENLKITHETY